nr:MAG TPA: hypothetical protein [Caudoviricetes sp.]
MSSIVGCSSTQAKVTTLVHCLLVCQQVQTNFQKLMNQMKLKMRWTTLLCMILRKFSRKFVVLKTIRDKYEK